MPRKRIEESDSDEEDVPIAQLKRRRSRSNALNDDPSPAQEEDDDEQVVKASQSRALVLEENLMLFDDDGMDVGDEEGSQDADERDRGEDEFAECGILKDIKLRNFMCHELFIGFAKQLHVEFGPNVNFIHGNNGAGKSAILLGICTCFGMRASETKRASSVKGLIKHGEDHAIVAVTITNAGKYAFKNEVFGDEIVIERHLSRNGSNKYVLKGESGKAVKGDRDTVDRILSHFGIAVDNPCCVLNQETAREFLKSNSPHKRFEYFFKATQLQAMKQTLLNSIRMRDSVKEDLSRRESVVKEREEAMIEAKETAEVAQKLEQIDVKLRDAQLNLVWARVSEKEELLKSQKAKVAILSEKLDEYKDKLKVIEKEIMDRKVDEAAASKAHKEFLNQRRSLNDSIAEKRKKLSVEGRRLNDLKRGVSQHDSKIAKFEKEKDKIQREIAQLHASSNVPHAAEFEKLQSKKSSLESDLNRAKFDIEKLDLKIQEYAEKESQLKRVLGGHKNEVQQINREIQQLKDELRRVQNSSNDRLALFGEHARSVDRAISQSRKFRVKPIGPIGNFITLQHDDRGIAVESAIGKKLLQGYIVDNHEDFALLKQILRQFYKNYDPLVIIQKISDRRYQMRSPEYLQRKKWSSVLDEIVVDNTWVFNVLVDQAKPERALIASDYKEAYNILQDIQTNDSASRSFVSAVYSLNGSRSVEKGGHIANYRTQVDRSSLCKDMQSQENAIKENIAILNNKLAQSEESSKGDDQEYKRIASHFKTFQSEKSKLQSEIGKFQKGLAYIKTQLEEMQDSQDFDDSDLQQEISDIDQKIADELSLKSKSERDLEKVQYSIEELQKEHDEMVEEAANEKTIDANLRNKLKVCVEHLEEAKEIKEKIRRNIQKIEEKLKSFDGVIAEISAQISEYESTALAASKGERLHPTTSVEEIRKEITELQNLKISERARLDSESPEQAFKRYKEAYVAFADAKGALVTSVNNIKELEVTIKIRHKDYQKFMKACMFKAKKQFCNNLTSQGYSGGLEFDPMNEKLDIEFSRRDGHATSSKDTRTLSGGERSFSTLCFVISIFQQISSPFMAMDEFDIFMDSVNRRISTQLLLNLAQKAKSKQFLFISPHDISMFEPSESIRIHRLKAPERNS